MPELHKEKPQMSEDKKLGTYEAVLEYDHESGEYVLEWGGATAHSGGSYRSSDKMEIYKRLRNFSCEGWKVTVEPHSMPNVSVNEYASPGGGLPNNPRHRYDCVQCKFAWNCGLACGCHLSRKEYAEPPEEVKLNRLRAFLECGDDFIKDRKSLEAYIEGIWKDD